MVWFSLSYFLFYGFYPSLIYKKVVKEGNHTILFYTYTPVRDKKQFIKKLVVS